jgi:transcriptional regulator with XRE-family HTH domain
MSMPSYKRSIQQRLGKNIQRVRKVRGMSQETLAEVVNISRTHMGHIEQGRRVPSIKLLDKIASALKVPLSELF